MGAHFLQKTHNGIIAIIALILLALSLKVHFDHNFFLYRSLRGVSCFVFLGYLLYLKKIREYPLLILFLFFYGISSFIIVWYENSNVAIVALLFNLIAILLLIKAIWPKVNFKKMNLFFISLLSIVVFLIAFLLFKFILMIEGFTETKAHFSIIFIGSLSFIVLCYLTLLYNYIHSTKASLIFTLFIFGILFGEVFRAIGYYDFTYGNEAVYLARALLLISLSLLVNYTTIDTIESETLSKRIF